MRPKVLVGARLHGASKIQRGWLNFMRETVLRSQFWHVSSNCLPSDSLWSSYGTSTSEVFTRKSPRFFSENILGFFLQIFKCLFQGKSRVLSGEISVLFLKQMPDFSLEIQNSFSQEFQGLFPEN